MAEAAKNIVLHIADVHKSFGGLHALADVDLAVEEGKTHAIIGPNGAGKSTLLNVIVGKLEPTRGKVVLDGELLTGKKPHEINQMGVARVFQTPEIFPELSVLDNVMISAFAKRDGAFKLNIMNSLESETDIQEKARKIIIDFGLDKQINEHSGALSRGHKRRLELAMCLIQEPRLLLLDEPTAGMSRHDTSTTIDLLKEIKSTGMTIVIIEHDMHVVFSVADKVSVLAGGRIIAEGSPEEIRASEKVKKAYLGEAQ